MPLSSFLQAMRDHGGFEHLEVSPETITHFYAGHKVGQRPLVKAFFSERGMVAKKEGSKTMKIVLDDASATQPQREQFHALLNHIKENGVKRSDRRNIRVLKLN